jgi:hypothetical protein
VSQLTCEHATSFVAGVTVAAIRSTATARIGATG